MDFLTCLIFPHPSNNHRAKLLHHKVLLALICLIIVSSFFFSSNLNPFPKDRVYADVSVQSLVDMTNRKRAENNLPPLVLNEQLNDAAGRKLNDMFEKGYWAHNAPDGTTPWVFVKAAGYNYVYAGENLARGFGESQDVVNAWMASSSHKDNILSKNYSDVGFAIRSGVLNGEQTVLVAQYFGGKAVLPAKNIETAKPNVEVGEAGKIESLPTFNPSLIASETNLSTSQAVIIILMSILITILAIDVFVARRKNVFRFVGHNLDHTLFLAGIIIFIVLFGRGSIL